MVSESEQHKIIKQILSGDPRQLDMAAVALRACSKAIVKKIVRIGGNKSDIETILNDTVLEIIKSIQDKNYDPDRAGLDGFIFSIVKHKWMDVLKKRYREKEKVNDYTQHIQITSSNQNTIEKKLFSEEQRAKIRTVLEQLDPIDREIVEKKHLRGISLRIIAKHLGITEDAVKKRHERCKKKLQKILGQDPRIDD
jgi:RNA polymerase sigma-70 factor (ECF subfamily)